MATEKETGVKSEAKTRFSFRETLRRLTKNAPSGRSASTLADNAATGELNRAKSGAHYQLPQKLELPIIDSGPSLSELWNQEKPLPEKPLPSLPRDEEAAKLAVDRIIARQAGKFAEASAKLGLGNKVPLASPVTREDLPNGTDSAPKLPPAITRRPRTARTSRSALPQGGPSMVEPSETSVATAVATTVREAAPKLVTITNQEKNAIRSHAPSEIGTVSRSPSVSSMGSTRSSDTVSSNVSELSTDTRTTSVRSPGPLHDPQADNVKETRTRPSARELYEPGLHTPARGR